MDTQVSVRLECKCSSLPTLKRRYIRCSAEATITHLKKFIAMKVLNNIEKYREIDILCENHLLGKDLTLKFVHVTYWRYQYPPLLLHYKLRMEYPILELLNPRPRTPDASGYQLIPANQCQSHLVR